METPAMEGQKGNTLDGDEVNEANEGWPVPVDALKENGVAPSDGDECKFEATGIAKGAAKNGFITIMPKTVNGMDVPNSVSQDNSGDAEEGSGPESNDDNDELASARSQYNEQSMNSSPGY